MFVDSDCFSSGDAVDEGGLFGRDNLGRCFGGFRLDSLWCNLGYRLRLMLRLRVGAIARGVPRLTSLRLWWERVAVWLMLAIAVVSVRVVIKSLIPIVGALAWLT